MEWSRGQRKKTSHALLDGLLVIFPKRSLKMMTMSLSADGCIGDTVHYTSTHTQCDQFVALVYIFFLTFFPPFLAPIF
jgi:hypothetical protein